MERRKTARLATYMGAPPRSFRRPRWLERLASSSSRRSIYASRCPIPKTRPTSGARSTSAGSFEDRANAGIPRWADAFAGERARAATARSYSSRAGSIGNVPEQFIVKANSVLRAAGERALNELGQRPTRWDAFRNFPRFTLRGLGLNWESSRTSDSS